LIGAQRRKGHAAVDTAQLILLVSWRSYQIESMTDTKHAISVYARAAFVPDKSDASRQRFVFAYRITITNTGQSPLSS
jgi:hypothetical protein